MASQGQSALKEQLQPKKDCANGMLNDMNQMDGYNQTIRKSSIYLKVELLLIDRHLVSSMFYLCVIVLSLDFSV